MDADTAAALFTRSTGEYLFARWGRPIVPVVFGVEEATVSIVKGAIEAVVALAGHKMAETDPELGANLMIFFICDWDELTETPNLHRLIPDLGPLVERLKAADANQYRSFRFDDAGAIQASFVFVRMDAAMRDLPAETIALGQIVQVILLWSDTAFAETEIAEVIRAAYDPVMPVSASDPAHALRLAARVSAPRPG